jgi:hypothetical protein
VTNPAHHLAQQGFTYAQTQTWDVLLARQQEIYEELIASRELVSERQPAGPKPSRKPASARELTRDLAGWSPQLAGVLNRSSQQPGRS